MYISKNWIQDFVDIPSSLTTQDIANRLTLATTEIEGTKDFSEILANIIIGKVTKKEKHPKADRLHICHVFDGKETYQVVCGANNVEQDMLIAFAPIGTKVKWHGKEEVILEKATIRGVESHGMICASVEIGLTDSSKEEDGILDLTSTQAQPGTPLAQALHLDDVVFELDNKSITHRPDLWGHYGMAREFSALYEQSLKPYPSFDISFQKNPQYSLQIEIQDKKACSRYQGIIIEQVKVQPSPAWMQARLIACGMRPINNVVDITNYVMLELGQPLHAFDVDQIAKKEGDKRDVHIRVRKAKKGDILTTLDGNTHELSKEHLVITNESEILALAGVKGGLHSGITNDTTCIMLESAHFDAATIRKGSTAIGIRSEASARFEKTLDSELTSIALRRACQLFKEHIPGIVFATEVVDQNFSKQKQIVLKTSAKYIQQRIGMDIAQEEIERILKNLGFGVIQQKNKLKVEVPSFRATKDVLHEYDLVEEVVRIYGYDRIIPSLPEVEMKKAQINEKREFEKHLKQIFVGNGYTEVYNYAFTSITQQEPFSDMSTYIEVADPFSSQVTHLRKNLIAGLLENVKTNEHVHDRIHVFEMGRVFLSEEQSMFPLDDTQKGFVPKQPVMLGIIVSDKEGNGFYVLKGMVEKVLDTLHIPYQVAPSTQLPAWSQMGASADIIVEGNRVGELSKVKGRITKQLGMKREVYQAQIQVDDLFEIYKKKKQKMIKMKKYPGVELDMAVIVDKYVLWQEVKDTILSIEEHIESVEIFDIYEGDQVQVGKKSMAFHIVYRSDEKTLTMQEANAVHQKVLNALQEKFQAQLRV